MSVILGVSLPDIVLQFRGLGQAGMASHTGGDAMTSQRKDPGEPGGEEMARACMRVHRHGGDDHGQHEVPAGDDGHDDVDAGIDIVKTGVMQAGPVKASVAYMAAERYCGGKVPQEEKNP